MSDLTTDTVTDTSATTAMDTSASAGMAEPAAATETVEAGSGDGDRAAVRAEQAAALAAIRARGGDGEEKPAASTERNRSPDGKFAKVGGEKDESEDDKKPEATEEPKDKTAKTEATAGEAPGHLANSIKAIWSTLSDDARKAIDGMARSQRDTASKYGNAERDFIKPFGSVLSKHADHLSSIGVENYTQAADAVSNLLTWNTNLAANPAQTFPALIEKYNPTQAEVRSLIGNLTRTFKLDPVGDYGQDEPEITSAADHETRAALDAAQRKIALLESQQKATEERLTRQAQLDRQARAEQARAHEDRQLDGQIASFSAKQDPAEWELLRPMVHAELLKMEEPGLTADQALARAWDTAKKKMEGLVSARVSAAEKARNAAAQKAAEAARRAGSVNIDGAPAPTPAAMSVRDEQRAALARARASAH